MLGPLIIYPLWLGLCIAGLFRPWIGLIGFYGCVLLEPNWNWRWSISADFEFQKYLALTTLLGVLLNRFPGNRFHGVAFTASLSLAVFLAIAYLSAQFSIAPETSAFYMSNLWKIVLMAVLAVFLLDSPKKIEVLLWVMIIAQGYSALRINEQYFQDGFSLYAYRPWGSKGDNNLYTIMTVPLVACSAALCVTSVKNWQRILAGAIFLLQAHQVMLLQSRGGMLAAIGMMGIFAMIMPRNRFTLSAAGLGLVAVLALAGPSVVDEFNSAFQPTDQLDSSAESRYKLWKAGAEITADYPLLGVGPYAGQRLVPQYYDGELSATNKGLHNLLFEITTGCGIPAAICYFGFFAIAWFVTFQLRRRERRLGEPPIWLHAVLLSVIAGLPGYLAASMFSSGALLESSYVLASVGLASSLVWQRQLADGLSGDGSTVAAVN